MYRAALPLSSKTLDYAAGIIRRHRASIGSAWRKLNPGQRVAWLMRAEGLQGRAAKRWEEDHHRGPGGGGAG